MRLPRLPRPAPIAVLAILVTACGPGDASTRPDASTRLSSTAPGGAPSASAGMAIELDTTPLPLQPMSIGVPSGWVVLDGERLVELTRRLREIEPALADEFEMSSLDDLRAVDFDALPGSFSSLRTSFSCDTTQDVAELLERLRDGAPETPLEGGVVELPAGQAALVSLTRTVGSLELATTVYALPAPTTTCAGTLYLFVAESQPWPGLAAAIAQSIMIGSSRGTVTLVLRESVTLQETPFSVVCELGGDTGEDLRMSSGTAVDGMIVDLAVDVTGQPTFFQFANGELAYFSGKGFEASDAFEPDPGSTRERGAASFTGITPPDDPDHVLSGRVTWECAV